MVQSEVLKKIEDLANQVATREGCKLYDLEFAGGRVLRVYIDKDIAGGAALEDCTNVSRGLNLLLDVEDVIPGGQYHLEVSTPGIERPLRKAWHFKAVQGQKIWARLNQNLQSLGAQNKKIAAHKQISEVLHAASDVGVEFHIEDEIVKVPYEAIEKANVVFEFEALKGKKKRSENV